MCTDESFFTKPCPKVSSHQISQGSYMSLRCVCVFCSFTFSYFPPKDHFYGGQSVIWWCCLAHSASVQGNTNTHPHNSDNISFPFLCSVIIILEWNACAERRLIQIIGSCDGLLCFLPLGSGRPRETSDQVCASLEGLPFSTRYNKFCCVGPMTYIFCTAVSQAWCVGVKKNEVIYMSHCLPTNNKPTTTTTV